MTRSVWSGMPASGVPPSTFSPVHARCFTGQVGIHAALRFQDVRHVCLGMRYILLGKVRNSLQVEGLPKYLYTHVPWMAYWEVTIKIAAESFFTASFLV